MRAYEGEDGKMGQMDDARHPAALRTYVLYAQTEEAPSLTVRRTLHGLAEFARPCSPAQTVIIQISRAACTAPRLCIAVLVARHAAMQEDFHTSAVLDAVSLMREFWAWAMDDSRGRTSLQYNRDAS